MWGGCRVRSGKTRTTSSLVSCQFSISFTPFSFSVSLSVSPSPRQAPQHIAPVYVSLAALSGKSSENRACVYLVDVPCNGMTLRCLGGCCLQLCPCRGDGGRDMENPSIFSSADYASQSLFCVSFRSPLPALCVSVSPHSPPPPPPPHFLYLLATPPLSPFSTHPPSSLSLSSFCTLPPSLSPSLSLVCLVSSPSPLSLSLFFSSLPPPSLFPHSFSLSYLYLCLSPNLFPTVWFSPSLYVFVLLLCLSLSDSVFPQQTARHTTLSCHLVSCSALSERKRVSVGCPCMWWELQPGMSAIPSFVFSFPLPPPVSPYDVVVSRLAASVKLGLRFSVSVDLTKFRVWVTDSFIVPLTRQVYF